MVIGLGPDPAPYRRRTPVRKHAIPPRTRRFLEDMRAVDPPEWAWIHGIEVHAPTRLEEEPS